MRLNVFAPPEECLKKKWVNIEYIKPNFIKIGDNQTVSIPTLLEKDVGGTSWSEACGGEASVRILNKPDFVSVNMTKYEVLVLPTKTIQVGAHKFYIERHGKKDVT